MTVEIVAVIYEEPDYRETRDAIEATREACGVPVRWVDRRGVGSLAQAINQGVRRSRADAVWCVTNIRFGPDVLPRLAASLSARPDFAAIQPAYESDHPHLRPDGTDAVREGPFVEFTCPLVRREVLVDHPLDERMPYWGHDLDWGHRVRAAGWRVGVDQGATVGHTYIRNAAPHPVTAERWRRRKATDRQTRQALAAMYGAGWRAVLGWV